MLNLKFLFLPWCLVFGHRWVSVSKKSVGLCDRCGRFYDTVDRHGDGNRDAIRYLNPKDPKNHTKTALKRMRKGMDPEKKLSKKARRLLKKMRGEE